MKLSQSRVLLGALLCGMMVNTVYAGEVNAAVAANFAEPMGQIAKLFQQASGHTVKVSLGSTGKFYSQIQNGAPFDVLVAADDKVPLRLEKEGLAVDGSRFIYALGKLVLWSAQSGYVDDKGHVLRKGDYNKLAIGDPKLASYGTAAKEALEELGLWGAVQSKLVMGENITQTYQFAATGNADLAFIALSQITQNGKVTNGSWWIVPAHLYNPIKQSAVQLSAAKDKAAAQAFLIFLKSDKAKTIIRSFGYELP
ncbi:MAG: molybdate ABC transporter substrate-binding protein [Gallionella sp.]|nr:molybdate ABC transporter substrate-binding protein [Gallionella sp.]MDD4959603.1 molybdate ABC transporter substrate-binding protein [Gallionella sp.]